MDINEIKSMCENKALRWTNHVLMRLLQRNISLNDVISALINGEIIEQYTDDYPYPSCLVLGITLKNKYIHVVCGIGDGELWIITAYYPDLKEWESDFKTRKAVI